MRKLYIKALSLGAIISISACTSYTFNGSEMGDSVSTVKLNESNKLLSESPSRLSYSGSMGGMTTETNYFFENEKLSLISLCLDQKVESSEVYLIFYDATTDTMTETLGKPTISEFWEGEIHADIYDHPDLWGKAISQNYLSILSEWHTKDTDAYTFIYPTKMHEIEEYKDLDIVSCLIIKDSEVEYIGELSLYNDTLRIKERYQVDEN